MNVCYTLFETSIGSCGIAWSERGVVTVLLPESTDEATLQRLRGRWPSSDAEANPPAAVAEVIRALTAHLDGHATDLSSVVLDDQGVAPFARRVYAAARAIPSGETRTYGEIANTIGSPAAARAVGQALGKNPFPLVVPCHRVLGSGGHAGGFTAPGGLDTKARILSIEGVTLRAPRPGHWPDLVLAGTFRSPSNLRFEPPPGAPPAPSCFAPLARVNEVPPQELGSTCDQCSGRTSTRRSMNVPGRHLTDRSGRKCGNTRG